jgi:hypothetical protein
MRYDVVGTNNKRRPLIGPSFTGVYRTTPPWATQLKKVAPRRYNALVPLLPGW